MKTKANKKRIYLDYASLTPIDKRVRAAMLPLLKSVGNPDALYREGVAAKEILKRARSDVARFFGVKSDEVVFTSGGTESNNLAILGATAAAQAIPKGDGKIHAVTLRTEHSSVLAPFRELERRGIMVTYLGVKSDGLLDLKAFEEALRPETFLISISYANNEIGVIQPIHQIGQIIRRFRSIFNHGDNANNGIYPLFHVDACQAPPYLPVKAESLGADLISVDGGKSYGPSGVGALFVRRGTPLSPLLLGGGQELGRRSGTAAVYLAVGLAKALQLCEEQREAESARLFELRNQIYFQILKHFERRVGKTQQLILLNGSLKRRERLPNNLNISLPGVDTEMLTLKLDTRGFAVSTKSACLAEERESYVVRALGRSPIEAGATLRISLGRGTTAAQVKKFIFEITKLLES
jgi:cysteine desulfurase